MGITQPTMAEALTPLDMLLSVTSRTHSTFQHAPRALIHVEHRAPQTARGYRKKTVITSQSATLRQMVLLNISGFPHYLLGSRAHKHSFTFQVDCLPRPLSREPAFVRNLVKITTPYMKADILQGHSGPKTSRKLKNPGQGPLELGPNLTITDPALIMAYWKVERVVLDKWISKSPPRQILTSLRS